MKSGIKMEGNFVRKTQSSMLGTSFQISICFQANPDPFYLNAEWIPDTDPGFAGQTKN
jgi:hypothetical protein